MKKCNGFSLVEVLVAFGIILMIATMLIPLATLMNSEREFLSIKRSISYQLHDDIQPYIWDSTNKLPNQYQEVIQGTTVIFSFSKVHGNYVMGCAKWEPRGNKKEICIYGLPEE